MNKSYVVVDIETTWLKRTYHKITEIAAVRYDWSMIVEQFQSLVNPQVLIPSFISRLTGITNEMVAHQPTIDQLLPDFFDFLGDDIFVAHNATFDRWFLEYNGVVHTGHIWKNKTLCTRKLANRMFSQLPSKSLWALCEYFCIQNEQAHRAMADVQATVKLLQQCIVHYQQITWHTNVDELLTIHDKPISYGKKLFSNI